MMCLMNFVFEVELHLWFVFHLQFMIPRLISGARISLIQHIFSLHIAFWKWFGEFQIFIVLVTITLIGRLSPPLFWSYSLHFLLPVTFLKQHIYLPDVNLLSPFMYHTFIGNSTSKLTRNESRNIKTQLFL
jgi:hypothetical protein